MLKKRDSYTGGQAQNYIDSYTNRPEDEGNLKEFITDNKFPPSFLLKYLMENQESTGNAHDTIDEEISKSENSIKDATLGRIPILQKLVEFISRGSRPSALEKKTKLETLVDGVDKANTLGLNMTNPALGIAPKLIELMNRISPNEESNRKQLMLEDFLQMLLEQEEQNPNYIPPVVGGEEEGIG